MGPQKKSGAFQEFQGCIRSISGYLGGVSEVPASLRRVLRGFRGYMEILGTYRYHRVLWRSRGFGMF